MMADATADRGGQTVPSQQGRELSRVRGRREKTQAGQARKQTGANKKGTGTKKGLWKK